MEGSELVMRETPWQKIKRFFSGIVTKFRGEELKLLPEAIEEEQIEENDYVETIEPEDFSRFDSVTCAVKLLNREMSVQDLTIEQVEEMISFFEKEIATTTAEIDKIQRV